LTIEDEIYRCIHSSIDRLMIAPKEVELGELTIEKNINHDSAHDFSSTYTCFGAG